jgi:uroporphyrinogen III methyltransferase/synthase
VLAAIGPATAAALESRGAACEIVPDDYIAEGLLEALGRRGVAPRGARVLIPRAAEARNVLPDTLRAGGARVDVLPVYDTLPEEELAVSVERLTRADFITFTSSSTVREFVALLERAAGPTVTPAGRLAGVRLCSIGPVTSATLREHGLRVAVEAVEYTTAGLVAAIVAAAA